MSINIIPAGAKVPSPLDFIFDGNGASPLYAAYLHGTDAHIGAASAGAPLTDLSGNGRTLTKVGTDNATNGQKPKWFAGDNGHTLLAPWTLDQLIAAGGVGEYCIMHVFKGASGVVSRPFQSTATAPARQAQLQSTDTYTGQTTVYDDVAFTGAVILASSWRTTDYFLLGVNQKVTRNEVFAIRANSDPAIGFSTPGTSGTRQIGGSAPSFGSAASNGYAGDLVATLAYRRSVTPAEMTKSYLGLQEVVGRRLGLTL